jgi:hypothetical protein
VRVFGDPPDFTTAERDEATILLALCDEPARIVPNTLVDAGWTPKPATDASRDNKSLAS